MKKYNPPVDNRVVKVNIGPVVNITFNPDKVMLVPNITPKTKPMLIISHVFNASSNGIGIIFQPCFFV